jgi:hypothetical protein
MDKFNDFQAFVIKIPIPKHKYSYFMAGFIFASYQKFKAIFMCFTIKWQPTQKNRIAADF